MEPTPRNIQLTAYALGELPPDEAAEVEARLATSEEDRRFVEQIRQTGDQLAAAFAEEPSVDALSDEQRQAIAEAVDHPLMLDDDADDPDADAQTGSRLRLPFWIGQLAAACLLVAATVAITLSVADDPVASTQDRLAMEPGDAADDRAESMVRENAETLESAADAPAAMERRRAQPPDSMRDEAVAMREEVDADVADDVAPGPTPSAERPAPSDALASRSARAPEEPEADGRDIAGTMSFADPGFDNRGTLGFTPVSHQPVISPEVALETERLDALAERLGAARPGAGDRVPVDALVSNVRYSYPAPRGATEPVAVYVETNAAPWNPQNQLVRIGLQATGPSHGEDRSGGAAAAPKAGKKIETEAQASASGELRQGAPIAAEDVQLEIRFNTEQVAAYRMITPPTATPAGSGARRDDKSRALSLEPGQQVTTLFEIIPSPQQLAQARIASAPTPDAARSQLRAIERQLGEHEPGTEDYTRQLMALNAGNEMVQKLDRKQTSAGPAGAQAEGGQTTSGDELLTVNVRFRLANGPTQTVSVPVPANARRWTESSKDQRFLNGVANFQRALEQPQAPAATQRQIDEAIEQAEQGLAEPDRASRAKVIDLMKQARQQVGEQAEE